MGTTWLLTIGAGISLLVGHGGGLYLLAFGLLLGIALQVVAAWTLVVETGKHARAKDIGPGLQDRPESERQASGRVAGDQPDSGIASKQAEPGGQG